MDLDQSKAFHAAWLMSLGQDETGLYIDPQTGQLIGAESLIAKEYGERVIDPNNID